MTEQPEHPLNIAVIVGSTRHGRFGPVVADWFATHARARSDMAVDLVDLADVELPAVHPAKHVPELDAWLDVCFCLEPHDLVASKLAAGRPKDFEFAAALLREHLVDRATLDQRINALPIAPADRTHLVTWLAARC